MKTIRSTFICSFASALLWLWHASLLAAPGVLEIHVINVQQGASSLIIGPDGTTLLIDAGFPGKGTARVVPYLQSIAIQPAKGLDYMLLSHRHTDHYGGLPEVLSAGYDVKKGIWDNGSPTLDTNYQPFLAKGGQTTAGMSEGGVLQMPLGHVIDLGDGATATCVAVKGTVINHGAVQRGSKRKRSVRRHADQVWRV